MTGDSMEKWMQADLAIVAGPSLARWPSNGVDVLSLACSRAGLDVVVVGGTQTKVRGALPFADGNPGGTIVFEDAQKRVHFLKAKSIVKVRSSFDLPQPFEGSHLEGAVPIATARRLLKETRLSWDPAVAILGSGSLAMDFGSKLLEEKKVRDVYIIESSAGHWAKKNYSGWEVFKRKYLRFGGKWIQGEPLQLSRISPSRWDLRVQEDGGKVRVIEMSRLVVAGPFSELKPYREYPVGSLCYEWDQTSVETRDASIEGYELETRVANRMASKIIRALGGDLSLLGDLDASQERKLRRARKELQDHFVHRVEPFALGFDGKWLDRVTKDEFLRFPGTPDPDRLEHEVASIECVENISCKLCQEACPTGAIVIHREESSFLRQDRCTACRACLIACPAEVPVLLQQLGVEDAAKSKLTFIHREEPRLKVGELVTGVNRHGGLLTQALRVVRIEDIEIKPDFYLVTVEVPNHLLWEVRGLKRLKATGIVESSETAEGKVEIKWNGETRLCEPNIPLSLAFFQMGKQRAEDSLLCSDGSCGRCEVEVDGGRKLACQTKTRAGMLVLSKTRIQTSGGDKVLLCPCQQISLEDMSDAIDRMAPSSPESIMEATQVCQGACHGLLCEGPLRRLLVKKGVSSAESWIFWQFPWVDWVRDPKI